MKDNEALGKEVPIMNKTILFNKSTLFFVIAVVLILVLAACSRDGIVDDVAGDEGSNDDVPVMDTEMRIEPEPPVATDTSEPEPEPAKIETTTYITKNATYEFDVPRGMRTMELDYGAGYQLLIETSSNNLMIHFYEDVPSEGMDTFYKRKGVAESLGEISPIMVAGKEGYYFPHPSPEVYVYLSVIFPNPTSDDEHAIWGRIFLEIDTLEGFELADYLEIPEIKTIVESIRIPDEE
jgi:hypothetical protein